jgi:hypothetical protein
LPVFDLFFNSIQAYNQIGLFVGALMCLGIGGLVLGATLYKRMHAIRATGTIIGVISKSGSMFTPVYRYTLPDGQTHEAKSDTSSGWVRGKETGRVVPLMISIHNPNDAQEADSYLGEIVGIVLIAPGLFLGYFAITAFPVTPMTWVMGAGMLLYCAERLHRIIIPKGQRLSLEEWRKQRGMDRHIPVDLTQVRPIEEILASPEATQSRLLQMKNNKKAAPILGIFIILLVGGSIYTSLKISRLEAHGLRAPGKVIRLQEEHGSKSSSYYPVVRYTTKKNYTIEFKDNVGSNPPSHHTGDEVTVLYLPEHPQKEAIIDRGIWNWLAPGILLVFAALLSWVLVIILRSEETKSQAFSSSVSQ